MKENQTLKCMLTNREIYGFSDTLNLKDPTKAHQIGVLGLMVNTTTGTIERNVLKNSLNATQFMNDPEVIVHPIHTIDKETNELTEKTLYMAPYQPTNHSWNLPTVFQLPEYQKDVILEITLAEEDNLIRSFLYAISTDSCSLLDLLDFALEDDDDCESLIDEPLLLRYVEEDDGFEESGYYVDYYDEIGNKVPVFYHSLYDIKDHVVSVRMVRTNEN